MLLHDKSPDGGKCACVPGAPGRALQDSGPNLGQVIVVPVAHRMAQPDLNDRALVRDWTGAGVTV